MNNQFNFNDSIENENKEEVVVSEPIETNKRINIKKYIIIGIIILLVGGIITTVILSSEKLVCSIEANVSEFKYSEINEIKFMFDKVKKDNITMNFDYDKYCSTFSKNDRIKAFNSYRKKITDDENYDLVDSKINDCILSYNAALANVTQYGNTFEEVKKSFEEKGYKCELK